MSVDFLDEKREEIAARLHELKPHVNEYQRLQAAADALGRVDTPAPRRPRGKRGSKPVKGRRPTGKPSVMEAPKVVRRGRRKGSGVRAVEALKHITDSPGIKIPELAGKMGIKHNYLYRVLPGLEKEGKIRKKDGGWHPAAEK